MKNNAEYLKSVMKKYGEAKAKRRRNINIITSATICLTLLISLSSVTILRNDDNVRGPGFGGGNEAASLAQGVSSNRPSVSISPSPSVSAEYDEVPPMGGENGVSTQEPAESVDNSLQDENVAESKPTSSNTTSQAAVSSRPQFQFQGDASSSYNSTASDNNNSTDRSPPDEVFVILLAAAAVTMVCVIILIANNIKSNKKH